MSAIFEIENANVWRGGTLALSDFSLTLRHGESVAILGPNGAGKSTFLKLLTGEVRPEADPATHCRLFGEELWSLEEIRHRIGVIMPEDVERFHPAEIARDAVLSSLRSTFGRTRDMRFSASEKQRAADVMALMGVEKLADREFGALSSGERRRILIATLRTLSDAEKDLVLVTHHPGEIPPEIHRVILLRDGRVFADGPKREVITSQRMSSLYQVDLRVRWSGGWCDVRPA